MDFTLSEPQTEFWQSMAKYVAYVSGVGGGKTLVACLKLIDLKLRYPKVPMLYGAPDYPLIRDIFYPQMEEILSTMPVKYKINANSNVIHFPRFGRIICKTLIDPAKLVGFQVGDAVLDEFDTIPTDKASKIWLKMISRVRFKYPDGKLNRMYVTTTPEGFKATYNIFKKSPIPGLHHLIQAKTKHNEAHLPEGFIESLIASYPPELQKAYLEGRFVNLTSGSVYYSYDRDFNDTEETVQFNDVLHIGCDFNVEKQAAIIFVYRNVDGFAEEQPHMVDELIDMRDTPDMIEAINERFPSHRIIMYPDSTGKNRNTTNVSETDISLLKDAGYAVRAKSSNPLVKDRVNSVNGMLHNGNDERRLRVNKRTCPNMVESLEQQVYDKNGRPQKEGVIEHRNDAMGYFVWYKHPIRKRRAQVSTYRL